MGKEITGTAWIADDDAEIRSAMALMMRLLGYELRGFKDVRSLAAYMSHGDRPDILFLDINMPEVSGLDFLSVLRTRPEYSNLPILIISSEGQEQNVEKVIRLGGDGFVFKPIIFEELESAINIAVKRRKALGDKK